MTSKDFRIEKDSLGEVTGSCFGSLWRADPTRGGKFPDQRIAPWRAFIWSIAAVKRAAALVNFELGLFNDEKWMENASPRSSWRIPLPRPPRK